MSKDNNELKPKSANTAYILNLLLPGIGNIYFGQKLIGGLIFAFFLLAVFLFFLQGATTIIGIAVIIISLIVAIPTAGLALLLGFPLGIIIMFMGASSLAIWIVCVLSSLFMVYRKEKQPQSDQK